MNNNLKVVIAFVIGGGIGSTITYFLFNRKEKKLYDELYNYVKNRKEKNSSNNKRTSASQNVIKPPNNRTKTEKGEAIKSYEKMMSKLGYINRDEQKNSSDNDIFLIPEEEYNTLYAEDEDFDNEELIYYADGVLAYMNDELVPDYEKSVGNDFIDYFKESGKDEVYVRNNKLKMDYSIIKSDKHYSEVVFKNPSLIEEEE